MMPLLNLPECNLKIKRVNGSPQVFDIVRRKFVVLSPEEWVRQHFIHYLIGLGYPQGLMAIEKKIELNGMDRRCDIVVYDRSTKPFMIVECKQPEVAIDQKAFDQISRYNLALSVDYLVVTNGLEHFAARMDYALHGYKFLQEVPHFDTLNEPLP